MTQSKKGIAVMELGLHIAVADDTVLRMNQKLSQTMFMKGDEEDFIDVGSQFFQT